MADHFVSLQLIGLTRAPSVKMEDERETVGIAQIAAQRDVLIIDDDIPGCHACGSSALGSSVSA